LPKAPQLIWLQALALNSPQEKDDPPETLQCEYCEATSEIPELFTSASNIFIGPHHVCVTCDAYRYRRLGAFFEPMGAPLTAGGTYVLLDHSLVAAIPVVVGVFIAQCFAIVFHELGHLAAAKLVGADVPVVSFGGGMNQRVVRWRNAFVLYSLAPSEGMVYASFATRNCYRLKSLLIFVAGPIANLLSAAAAYALFQHLGPDTSRLIAGFLVIWSVYNLFIGVQNLWPRRVHTRFGEVLTDGAQILALPRLSEKDIDARIGGNDLVLAYMEYQYGDKNRALELAKSELARVRQAGDDGGVEIKSLITALLADLHHTDEGIAHGRQFLSEDENLTAYGVATLKNNLACTLFESGDKSRLAEADKLSKDAFEAVPMLLPMISTRGSILIALGCLEEGVEMLSDPRFVIESRPARAAVLANKAIGLARLDKLDQAQAACAQAERLDASNRNIPLAKAAIADNEYGAPPVDD
jgi:tetratricopeptide (TPR) repeat protein